METYQTEEEQLEALKKWWQENGRSTVVAVALALGAGFGWQGWQGYKEQQSVEASIRYETLMEAINQAARGGDTATLKTLAAELKTDYDNTGYADFAALHLASAAVRENDLDAAQQELRWVLTRNPSPELRLLAELRLARVYSAQGNPRQALDVLQAAEPGAYAAAYAEAEGDAWLLLDDSVQAIAAYERAVNLAAATDAGASDSLRLKLEALTPIPARDLRAADTSNAP
ncbi:MAG: tetratricopeptide repeat protein [Pseudomonadota bacterium]